MTFAVPTGETFSFEEGDEELFSCLVGVNIFAFTETDDGTFVVNCKLVSIVQEVSFDAAGGMVNTPVQGVSPQREVRNTPCSDATRVHVPSQPDDWTVKRLLGKHSSRHHNPTIAGCVYLTGMIETWGRGIRKVFDECRKHGCPPPVCEVCEGNPGDIQVRIDAAPDTLLGASAEISYGVVNSSEKFGRTIKRTIKDVLFDAITSHPGIKAPELMEISGRGRTMVTDALSVLVNEGLIEYRGSRKTGGYHDKI